MIFVDMISEDKKDSFWYFNTLIAEEEVSDGGKLKLYAAGDIEVYLPLTNDTDEIALFKGNNAIAHAEKLGYTDIDIDLLHAEDQFRLANWFQYEYIIDDVSTYMDDVIYDYDEAVEGIHNYL